ncbi:MAG: hypothetical protein R3A11_08445 [Bdellovibrionota bacterium]
MKTPTKKLAAFIGPGIFSILLSSSLIAQDMPKGRVREPYRPDPKENTMSPEEREEHFWSQPITPMSQPASAEYLKLFIPSSVKNGLYGMYANIYKIPNPNSQTLNRFLYLPIPLLQTGSDGKAYTRVIQRIGEEKSIVEIHIVIHSQKYESLIAKYLSEKTNIPLSNLTIEPATLGKISLQFGNTNFFDIGKTYFYPNLDSKNASAGLSRKTLTFLIPVYNSDLNEFLSEFKNGGVDATLYYSYVTQEIRRSNLNSQGTVQISNQLKKDFFGGRQEILATGTQVVEFLARAAQDSRSEVFLEHDGKIKELFLNRVSRFIDQISIRAIALGDVTNQIVSKFTLDENSGLFAPNFISKMNINEAEAEADYSSIKNLYQQYSQKQTAGKAAGIFGFGVFGGSGSRNTNSGQMENDHQVNQTLREWAKGENWDGYQMQSLDVRLYQVTQVDLDQVMAETINITTVEQQDAITGYSTFNSVQDLF